MTEIAYKDGLGAPGVAHFNPELGRRDAALVKSLALCNEDFEAIGAINTAAPAGDTDPSPINGRLQRLAQQLTALIIANGNMAQDIASLLDAFSTPVGSLPAFTRAATLDILTKRVSHAAGGDYEIQAAGASGETVRVFRVRLSISGATALQLWDGPSDTGALIEEWEFGSAGFLALSSDIHPLFEVGTANTSLVLKSSAAVSIKGVIQYEHI